MRQALQCAKRFMAETLRTFVEKLDIRDFVDYVIYYFKVKWGTSQSVTLTVQKIGSKINENNEVRRIQ